MTKVRIGSTMLILCMVAMIVTAPNIDIPLNIWALLSLVIILTALAGAYLVIANIDKEVGGKR